MADLLNLAYQKSDRLWREAEEASELIQTADRFFNGILKYRDQLYEEIEGFDDFLASADAVAGFLKCISDARLKEANELQSFISMGHSLSRGSVEDGGV